MNRYHKSIQAAIGVLGDYVAKQHMLMRLLAELRELSDPEIGPDEERKFEILYERVAAMCGIPKEQILAPDSDVEGS